LVSYGIGVGINTGKKPVINIVFYDMNNNASDPITFIVEGSGTDGVLQ